MATIYLTQEVVVVLLSQNPECPFFHLLGLPRRFIEPYLKVRAAMFPCNIDAAFLSLATTMNFDGLSSLWLRNVTTYVFATAGGK